LDTKRPAAAGYGYFAGEISNRGTVSAQIAVPMAQISAASFM
jgi:hypothetical protein